MKKSSCFIFIIFFCYFIALISTYINTIIYIKFEPEILTLLGVYFILKELENKNSLK